MSLQVFRTPSRNRAALGKGVPAHYSNRYTLLPLPTPTARGCSPGALQCTPSTRGQNLLPFCPACVCLCCLAHLAACSTPPFQTPAADRAGFLLWLIIGQQTLEKVTQQPGKTLLLLHPPSSHCLRTSSSSPLEHSGSSTHKAHPTSTTQALFLFTFSSDVFEDKSSPPLHKVHSSQPKDSSLMNHTLLLLLPVKTALSHLAEQWRCRTKLFLPPVL